MSFSSSNGAAAGPEQHFVLSAGHDEALAASSVMDAMLEEEDKQKVNARPRRLLRPLVARACILCVCIWCFAYQCILMEQLQC